MTTVKNVAVFSFQKYDSLLIKGLTEMLGTEPQNVKVLSVLLDTQTAELAHGCEAVCVFVNDKADAACLKKLGELGVKLILTRSAGFNHIDLYTAEELGMTVMRVPQYSPEAVAEHAVGLLLALIRKLPKAYNRVREHNFNLAGLEGFTINGKVIGILGTGKIGQITATILKSFGPSRLLGHDVYQSDAMKAIGMEYCSVAEVIAQSDIISLHLPLLPNTYHVINKQTIAAMKPGVVIINTSRGGLIDADALEDGLKKGIIGGVGLDVYENEASFFFSDCSDQIITDDTLSRLLTYHNVIITAHQAFLTTEALTTIADTTVQNIQDFNAGKGSGSKNVCKAPPKEPAPPAQPDALQRGPSADKPK